MKKRNYTQSSLRLELCGHGQWRVFLTFKNTRYKLYCTDAQLIDEYHNEEERGRAERRLRMLCKLQGTKQKINMHYWPNPIIWEDVK